MQSGSAEKSYDWNNKYDRNREVIRNMEREGYYNRMGVIIMDRELNLVIGHGNESFEKNLINRERDLQKQWERERIDRSRYNKRYKEISMKNRIPNYLRVENMEQKRRDEIRALFKLRCGNLEEKNKYLLEIEERGCLFCGESEDNLKHYIKQCKKRKGDKYGEILCRNKGK